MPFVRGVVIGAYAGFMSPIGYQANLLIYGPGGYGFTDFIRVGAQMSLVGGPKCCVRFHEFSRYDNLHALESRLAKDLKFDAR